MGLILILVGTFNCLIKIITKGQFSNRWILVGICHSVPTKLYALENHNKRCLTLGTIVSMYLFRSTLNKEKRGLEPYFGLWMWNLASRKQINLYFAIAYSLSSSQTIQRKQISHLQNEIGLTWKNLTKVPLRVHQIKWMMSSSEEWQNSISLQSLTYIIITSKGFFCEIRINSFICFLTSLYLRRELSKVLQSKVHLYIHPIFEKIMEKNG